MTKQSIAPYRPSHHDGQLFVDAFGKDYEFEVVTTYGARHADVTIRATCRVTGQVVASNPAISLLAQRLREDSRDR